MSQNHVICNALVIIGALCMFAAIITSVRTTSGIPATYREKWRLLIVLMLFFLAGYLAFIMIESLAIPVPIELITATVFLGGACFVLLVLSLTKSIVTNLRDREQLLEEAKDRLEERVLERTKDLEQKTQEHIRLSAKNANLNVELLQVLDSAPDGITIIDPDFIFRQVNSTFSQIMGLPAHELIGQKCYDMIGSGNCHTDNCLLKRVLGGEANLEVEAKITPTATANAITCLINAAPFLDKDGKVLGVIESFRDISERKVMEERLRDLSITDDMTGLLNRRGFIKIANQQIETASRLDVTVFLLYADIDDFKQINDTLGHDVGDDAIKEAAALLRDTLRQTDVIGVARLGGDEFSVLMFSSKETTCANHPVIKRLENKLHERNLATTQPYQLSISFGLAQYDREQPQSLSELMSAGDQAMYDCKRTKKAMHRPGAYQSSSAASVN